jgi:hypothetical protein
MATLIQNTNPFVLTCLTSSVLTKEPFPVMVWKGRKRDKDKVIRTVVVLRRVDALD